MNPSKKDSQRVLLSGVCGRSSGCAEDVAVRWAPRRREAYAPPSAKASVSTASTIRVCLLPNNWGHMRQTHSPALHHTDISN